MSVLRTERKDYGGYEVWDSRDLSGPIYVSPHLVAECVRADGTLTDAGNLYVTRAILERIAGRQHGLR